MNLAGIDLAWRSKRNPTVVAFANLNGTALELTHLEMNLFGVDFVAASLAEYGCVNGVAIDAPLIINNQTGQRSCEKLIGKEYGARKASCHTSNLNLYPDADSVKLCRLLESQGYTHLANSSQRWQLECYPHPALIEIFGLPERHIYKKGRSADKRIGQIRLAELLMALRNSPVLSLKMSNELAWVFDADRIKRLKGVGLKQNEDALDAIVCVYTAGLYALGVTERVYGSAQEGYIYVPHQNCIKGTTKKNRDIPMPEGRIDMFEIGIAKWPKLLTCVGYPDDKLEKYRSTTIEDNWELAISGHWSDSPYHSGDIAYYIQQASPNTWVMSAVERNACLDDVTEEDVDEGRLNDDQIQAMWGMTLNEAQDQRYERIVAVLLGSPRELTSKEVAVLLYDAVRDADGKIVEEPDSRGLIE